MSTGTYLKPFRPPAPLKPGGASNAPGRKPWARRPPPKLCTSGFLSGSWKPPKRVTVAKPATSRLAKRCREVAAAHPPTVTNEDELSVESTAADSALWEAVAKDAAELVRSRCRRKLRFVATPSMRRWISRIGRDGRL